MPYKCAAPGCKSTPPDPYARKISFHKFPSDTALKEVWLSKIPRINWELPKHAVLCDLHFVQSDFILERQDSNKTRNKERGTKLVNTWLKLGVVPSVWPIFPEFFFKEHIRKARAKFLDPTMPTHFLLNVPKKKKTPEELREVRNSFASLVDLDDKIDLRSWPINSVVRTAGERLYSSIGGDTKPEIRYCLKIFSSLQFEMWCGGKELKHKPINDPAIAHEPIRLTSILFVGQILFYLKRIFEGEVEEYLDLLQDFTQ